VPLPVLVYAHGGGWVVGSVETHHPFCRLLSEAAGIVVLSVEYRLAPEHPFPAGLDDVLAASGWAATHAESFCGDPKRLLLGGGQCRSEPRRRSCESHLWNGRSSPAKRVDAAISGDRSPKRTSCLLHGNAAGYGLDASLMLWFWQQYARDVSPHDPQISPLRLENVPALPPTFVATAEYDPLRDEGIAYAEKLVSAGIAVTQIHAPDMHHDSPVHPGNSLTVSAVDCRPQ